MPFWEQISCLQENLLPGRYEGSAVSWAKMSCEAAESIEDAIHDNRMFAERAFYCIANGAGERYETGVIVHRKMLDRSFESSI